CGPLCPLSAFAASPGVRESTPATPILEGGDARDAVLSQHTTATYNKDGESVGSTTSQPSVGSRSTSWRVAFSSTDYAWPKFEGLDLPQNSPRTDDAITETGKAAPPSAPPLVSERTRQNTVLSYGVAEPDDLDHREGGNRGSRAASTEEDSSRSGSFTALFRSAPGRRKTASSSATGTTPAVTFDKNNILGNNSGSSSEDGAAG
ncbi:unnamed protein product, partial [Amoebophrya sp. A25]